MKKRKLGAAALLFAAGVGTCSQVRAAEAATEVETAKKDPVLAPMLAELERSKQELKLQDLQRPFFIQYRLDDVSEWTASADYGAVNNEHEQRRRVLRVTVLVGDYKRDSFVSRGDGAAAIASLDNDPAALRYQFWSATDAAYKNALNTYAVKQAALKRFEAPPTADDFSEEKPTVLLQPLQKLDLDRAGWKRELAEAAGLYAKDPAVESFADEVQYSIANARAQVVNRYIVNTEGSIVRKSFSGYQLMLSAGTQADDGMHLDRSYASTSSTLAGIDSAGVFRGHAVELLKTLHALRAAPVVAEEYHGPVLFSGDAAADVFSALFVPNIEADKPDIGTNSRTRGTYASAYHTRVLPNFVTVTDDPEVEQFAGKGLLGSYPVDDEAVKSRPVTLVGKGVLQNYAIGREPVKAFPNSNGHGRAGVGQPPVSLIGVMQVKTSQPASHAELEKRLLELGKEQESDVVYEVETLGPQMTPRLLYRVNVKDGSKQLVRGAVFDELDQRTLRADIAALGDDPFVDNIMGPIGATVITPSILFGDVEVKRANEEQGKLPYYSPPSEK